MAQIEAKGLLYLAGTLAARPAAAAANIGAVYYVNDSGSEALYYSTGSAWEVIWRKNPIAGRLWMQFNQTYTPTAFTAINFDAVDGLAMGVARSGARLQVPVAGNYLIIGHAQFDVTGVIPSFIAVRLTLNAANIREAEAECVAGNIGAGLITTGSAEVSVVRTLAANDLIGLEAQTDAGCSIMGGFEHSSLELVLVQ
jgi:hypothetical protein